MILAIHSSGFNARQWRRLGQSMEIVAPDLLTCPAGEPFHFREDVSHLATYLKEPAHVVGHSYGGFLALQLALAQPEMVRSLAGSATRPVEKLVVEKLASLMPRARRVHFEGLGHMGPIAAPDAINAEIKTHIGSLSS